MSQIVNDEQLTAVFAAAGKEYGYDRVEAEFTTFKDFKVRWQRSYRWAEFKVSDYLVGAPHEVIQDLAYTLFSKITCSGRKLETTALKDWVTAPEFIKSNRDLFIHIQASVGGLAIVTADGEVEIEVCPWCGRPLQRFQILPGQAEVIE